MRTAMRQILIPAERWEVMASANSCQIAAEHKGNRPVPVRTAEHEGFLYTAFGVLYGTWGEGRKSYVDAYRLLPESLYSGETTLVHHDEAAIQAGQRERGNHTGLIVAVKRQLMVCAERVRFLKDLPATRPLSLTEAEAYDENQRCFGWRSFWFREAERSWQSLRRHPVVRYRNGRDDRAVLFWRSPDGVIREMTLEDDVDLSPPECTTTMAAREVQLTLF